MKYSNPRLTAEFNDWPIGSNHRGLCKFEVEDGGKKGKRVVRTTTDKNGRWCKPKKDTYSSATCIVDGDDGRTYIISMTMHYTIGYAIMPHGFIKVSRSDFMQHETVWEKDGERVNGERFKELLDLLKSAK